MKTKPKQKAVESLQASDGIAVQRAKAALGDAIDWRLDLDIETMELTMLARVIGVEPEKVRERLDAATLAELLDWARRIGADGDAAAA